MKLEGEHRFTSSRPDVWAALQDPEMLANALPGVRRLEVDGPDRYKVTVTVGVGAVKGAYDGIFSLSDKQELESCCVVAEASGPPGSIATTATMRLADAGDGGGTLLTYEADAKVTGPLAGVGQRMVAAAAKKTTREFLEAIDRGLVSPPPPTPALAPEAPEGAQADVDQAPASSQAGRVFVPAPDARPDVDRDLLLFLAGALTGFAMGLVGVLVGRRAGRR